MHLPAEGMYVYGRTSIVRIRSSIPLFALLLTLVGVAAPANGATSDSPRCRAIVAERLGHFEDALRALASAEPSAETTGQRANRNAPARVSMRGSRD